MSPIPNRMRINFPSRDILRSHFCQRVLENRVSAQTGFHVGYENILKSVSLLQALEEIWGDFPVRGGREDVGEMLRVGIEAEGGKSEVDV